MVDLPRLRSLVSRMMARRRELAPFSEMSEPEYLADARSRYASRYLLLTAIEDALSVANHVIASEGLRAPDDYADAFRSLAEAGVVDADLAHRLEAMARFRNLLVHVYAEVDDRRVRTFLDCDLDDLDSFARAVIDRYGGGESS